jgi:hypothetical protein
MAAPMDRLPNVTLRHTSAAAVAGIEFAPSPDSNWAGEGSTGRPQPAGRRRNLQYDRPRRSRRLSPR